MYKPLSLYFLSVCFYAFFVSRQDWISYEEFSDSTESNVFLNSDDNPNSQSGAAANSGVSGMAPLLHPDAVHCPKASGNDQDDVSEI